ncbi:interleukin-3 receptor subunit alpha isoform X1 [Choloepus didactylus]|uniref:interleukin-3 receptor subunit alpha isoform X1 n=1 Tax=Choloepus didactylus TaxID=27675 RepID=UPI0018A0AF58|nr:interleukin-3 receptor subunit alpha isoform X1 [Choloepus didactylus]
MVILFLTFGNHQTDFHSGCTIVHSHQPSSRVLSSSHPQQHQDTSFNAIFLKSKNNAKKKKKIHSEPNVKMSAFKEPVICTYAAVRGRGVEELACRKIVVPGRKLYGLPADPPPWRLPLPANLASQVQARLQQEGRPRCSALSKLTGVPQCLTLTQPARPHPAVVLPQSSPCQRPKCKCAETGCTGEGGGWSFRRVCSTAEGVQHRVSSVPGAAECRPVEPPSPGRSRADLTISLPSFPAECGHEEESSLSVWQTSLLIALGTLLALGLAALLCRRYSVIQKVFPPIPRVKDPIKDNFLSDSISMMVWDEGSACLEECRVEEVQLVGES